MRAGRARPEVPRARNALEAAIEPLRAERSATYPPDPHVLTEARRFVRQVLAEWNATEVEADALLLASELLANAFLHAGTTATMHLQLYDEAVQISVEDHYAARALPVAPVPPPPDSEGRRGLLLVSRLAQRWGVEYAGSTKRVWFSLALTTRSRPPLAPLAAPAVVADVSPKPRVAAVTLDAEGVVTAWPPEAEELTGRAADETVGSPYRGLVVWPDPPPGGTSLDEALGLGRWEATYAIERPGGAPVEVFASHLRLDGAGGGPDVVVLLTAAADRILLERPEPAARPPTPRPLPVPGTQLAIDALLSEALTTALDVLPGEAAYALLVGEDDDVLEVRAAVGAIGPHERVVQVGPRQGTAGRVSPLVLPMVIGDLTSEPAPPVPDGHDFRSLVAAPLLVSGRLTGALHVVAREPDRFTNADAVTLQQLADGIALATERGRLLELERRRRGRVAFLAEASELLSGTLDPMMTMAMLAQLVVPSLAHWCSVHLLDPAGVPRLVHAWHADESKLDELRAQLGEGGGSAGVTVAPPRSGRWQGQYVAAVPLAARGRITGLLTVGRADHPMARDDLTLVDDLARRAALAIDNGQLFAERASIAQTLQHSLLPTEIPHIEGCDFAVAYEAAGISNEVGGDFYDVFRIDDERAGIAVGDVCGKGAEAATVTGLARHALRLLARAGMPMTGVLDRLNAAILDEGPRARFVTLVYAELTPAAPGLDVRLIRAGHPPPFVLRAGGGCEPVGTAQPLLGVLDELGLHVDELHLDPGDVFVAYTDGVTERRSGDEMFGEHGVRAVLERSAGLSAASVVAALERAVSEYAAGPPTDDRALLAVRAT